MTPGVGQCGTIDRMPRSPGGRRGAARRAVPPALETSLRTPPEIIRAAGVTVHAQIEDWLAGEIALGTLRPGARLPAEQDLAAWFGVSRMTLRHSLGELARRGLVTKAVGRSGGTFVAEPKLEQDLTTLAGFSEQLRRQGKSAGARVLGATSRPAGPPAAAALGIADNDPVFDVRRIRLADGKPVAMECSLFPAALFPGMLECRLDGSLYELLEAQYGQRPYRARESLEPVIAGVREAEALDVAEGAPLMLVQRTAYNQSGTPLEFARDLFRGDRTRLVIWTSGLDARP
jgi:GntR family transcriptional regulator